MLQGVRRRQGPAAPAPGTQYANVGPPGQFAPQTQATAVSSAQNLQGTVLVGFEAPPEFNLSGRLRGQGTLQTLFNTQSTLLAFSVHCGLLRRKLSLLLRSGDSYLQHIAKETGSVVLLRGRGSVTQETYVLLVTHAVHCIFLTKECVLVTSQIASQTRWCTCRSEPLQVFISCHEAKGLEEAQRSETVVLFVGSTVVARASLPTVTHHHRLAANLIATVKSDFQKAYPYAVMQPQPAPAYPYAPPPGYGPGRDHLQKPAHNIVLAWRNTVDSVATKSFCGLTFALCTLGQPPPGALQGPPQGPPGPFFPPPAPYMHPPQPLFNPYYPPAPYAGAYPPTSAGASPAAAAPYAPAPPQYARPVQPVPGAAAPGYAYYPPPGSGAPQGQGGNRHHGPASEAELQRQYLPGPGLQGQQQTAGPAPQPQSYTSEGSSAPVARDEQDQRRRFREFKEVKAEQVGRD